MCRKLQIVAVAAAVSVVIVGSALAQQKGQRGRGGFGFGGGQVGLVTVAATEAVQKDLGLSGDVVTKLNGLRDDYGAAARKEYQDAGISFQNLSNEDRQKMTAITTKLQDEFNPKVKALVSADQLKRLEQIQLQANLRNNGPALLSTGDLATQLGITDEQKQKLNQVQQEFAGQRGGGGGTFDAAAFAKRRQDREAKTLEVLTSEQKQKLDTLMGSKFDVSQINAFGGGRRGKN